MNNLLTTPFYKWNIHDWIYCQITDYKCFDGLALGKKFFKDFVFWSRHHVDKINIKN